MGYYKYGGIYVPESSGSQTLKTKTHNPSNLLDPSTLVVGRINTTIGGNDTLNMANVNIRSTPAIAVEAGKVVSVGYIHEYNHNPFMIATSFTEWCLDYSFFTSAGIVLASGASRPAVSGGIMVPSGASYLRVSFFVDGYDDPTTNPEKFYVYVSDSNITNPTYYFEDGIEVLDTDDTMLLEHWGETWTLFGDSLTDSYGGHGWDASTAPVGGIGWKDTTDRVPWTGRYWASDIARRHGYTIDNEAHSGSNIYNSRVYNDVSGVLVLDQWVAKLNAGLIESPTLITIGFGANTVTDEIGHATDAASNTTKSLYAGTKYFIETLNRVCPYARKVYILHPLQEGWRETDGLGREALRSIFDSYNVEYIDMSKHSGITVDMLPDKLHVSSIEANKQYGRYLESYLF